MKKKMLVVLILFIIPFMVMAYLTGDVDGDGKTGASDYVAIRNHLLNKGVLTGDKLTRADVNNDGKVSSSDYVSIRKMIINGVTPTPVVTLTPTPTPVPTSTPTPVPKQIFTVKYYGEDIVETGLSPNIVLSGSKSVPIKKSDYISLSTNTQYVVSYDYVTSGGENEFDVDLYPDTLPQNNRVATTTPGHFDWELSSDNGDMGKCQLRFFDDIQEKDEQDITITNITMGTVKSVTKEEGQTLSDMPNPTRKGFRFLGWYTQNTGGTKVEPSTTVTGNLTLYAHWEAYYKHVFIIGVDGLGAALSKVDSPKFDQIFSEYAYRHDTITEKKTISAQNWGSILTGVNYKTHGMTNDSISDKERNSKSDNLSIFYYTKNAIPKAKLVSIVNWNPINHGIVENDLEVKKKHGDSDSEVTDKIIEYLEKKGAPTLMFVQFDEVDHAAHSHGGFSSEYYNAAEQADKRIGKIYNKIKSIGALDDSLFIVVADHGETSDGHGGKTKEESSALVAVRGYTVNNVKLDSSVHNRDVAAIALYALGVRIPSHFDAKVPSNLFNK